MHRHDRFTALVDRWLNKSASKADVELCENFLLGRRAGLQPCETIKEIVSDESTAPFYTYNRYHVKYSGGGRRTIS
jgi:hypothetical protein